MINILLGLAILGACVVAPPLVVPALIAWGLMAALDYSANSVPSEGNGCLTIVLMIMGIVVGALALGVLVVGGAMLEGRL